jgi:hypothetical protein
MGSESSTQSTKERSQDNTAISLPTRVQDDDHARRLVATYGSVYLPELQHTFAYCGIELPP